MTRRENTLKQQKQPATRRPIRACHDRPGVNVRPPRAESTLDGAVETPTQEVDGPLELSARNHRWLLARKKLSNQPLKPANQQKLRISLKALKRIPQSCKVATVKRLGRSTEAETKRGRCHPQRPFLITKEAH